jgi:uncharacterized protein (TIGR02117 family)
MRKFLIVCVYAILLPIAFIILYCTAAYCLSRIPVPAQNTSAKQIAIYIITNGVHTDIVMPIYHPSKDWNKIVHFTDTKGKDSSAAYIAMGWGDKGFYLHTPTWADLTFSVAFKAMFGLSSSAIHVTFHKDIHENQYCKKIYLNSHQYSQLIAYITKSLELDSSKQAILIKTDAVYGDHDAFYEANGQYSLFHTCNTWANNGLKSCGQKAALWTPFDTGIFYHYSNH